MHAHLPDQASKPMHLSQGFIWEQISWGLYFMLWRCSGARSGGCCCYGSQDVMLGCSTCSCPVAWLFISYWAASISGKWCSLSGCQVQNWTLNFPPKGFIEHWRRLDFVLPNEPISSRLYIYYLFIYFTKDNLVWQNFLKKKIGVFMVKTNS